MTRPLENPQNPYISCVVRASAGCGKTYQLSHRFLYLVAAGACPTTILTITFTKKAAAEMRERILEESANLLKSKRDRDTFDRQMNLFYEEAQQVSLDKLFKPLSSIQTAKKILASTQGLKINTIDSTFLEWVRKFPVESQGNRSQPLPVKVEMASESQSRSITKEAWERVCVDLFEKEPRKASILSPVDLEKRILELLKNQTFVWLSEQQTGNAFNPIEETDTESKVKDFKDLIINYKTEFLKIAEFVSDKKKDLIVTASCAGNLDDLISLRLLTKDLKISGSTIRGKKRETLAKEIYDIETAFGLLRDQKRIAYLNQVGSILTRLFTAFGSYRDSIKNRLSYMEFDDTAKGCYNLFSNPDNIGARFLIHKQVKHLMLDEFQDTSSLQWAVFKSIANEILSGQGLDQDNNTRSSLFIVGDEKQSIYGFREADSSILVSAALELKSFGVTEIPLNHSYRTSQIVLDLVNQSFATLIDNFPKHKTAFFGEQENLAVPNLGSLAVSSLFEDKNAIEDEAAFVASYLEKMITNKTPIYDKSIGQLRPLEAKDCAILYRASTHISTFESALREHGIEYRREENRGFFNRQEVRDIIHLLRFLSFPSDLVSFTAFMRSCLSPISEKSLIASLEANRGHSLPERVAMECLKDFFNRAPHFVEATTSLLQRSPYLSPSELIVEIFQSLDPVSRYKLNFEGAEGDYAEANLQQLFDIILDLQSKGYLSLQTLLEKLDECAKEDLIGSSSPSENSVRLMTIHKSKGLEFPLVAIIGLGEAWEKRDPYWIKQNRASNPGITYVGTAEDRPLENEKFNSLYQEVLDEDRLENTRLLYVAMTRAKHHLLLTGSRKINSRKDLGFHNHLYQTIQTMHGTEESVNNFTFLSLKQGLDANLEESKIASPKANLPLKFSKPTTSVQLEVKTLAPNKLLNRGDVDHDEAGRSPFQPFSKEAGTFIHKILETKANKNEIDLSSYWLSLFPGGDRARFETVGVLAEGHAAQVHSSAIWNELIENAKKIYTEMDIVHLDGSNLIRGSIDLLIQTDDQHWLVVDYKTTPIKDRSRIQDFIGDKGYDRQILAYVKAIKSLYKGSKVNGAIYLTESNILVLTHQEFFFKTNLNLIGKDNTLSQNT